MIKASLTYHDPLDIYDHFKSQFGNLSMLIKGNFAIMTFQNTYAKKVCLENPRRIIKGLPLTIRAFEEDQNYTKSANLGSNVFNNTNSNEMDIQNNRMTSQDILMLGDSISLPNINQSIKQIGLNYEKRIKQIKNNFLDEQTCNKKITEFNAFVGKYIQINQKSFQQPFISLRNALKRYSLNPQQEAIELEPTFTPLSNRFTNISQRFKNFGVPSYHQGNLYANYDIGSVKRLCLLNQTNFVTTLKLNQKNQQKGQLRIYDKQNHSPEFSLDIEQIPYSLMVHENFILAGDFNGYIHFVDVQNGNKAQFSNKLSPGLIVQMQKYDIKSQLPSMLTLITGARNQYKIKIFQIEKQNINHDIKTLTFHPKEQLLCQGMTMTMQTLQDGKFAYGCGRNTYIYTSFDKRDRDYITHDQNVMKIKKRNAQELIEATQRKIVMMDLRSSKLKNDIFDFKIQLNTIELISQNYVFYGGKLGQIGVIDCRKPNCHIWSPANFSHRGKISDILKIGADVITADSNGSIIQWKNQDYK